MLKPDFVTILITENPVMTSLSATSLLAVLTIIVIIMSLCTDYKFVLSQGIMGGVRDLIIMGWC